MLHVKIVSAQGANSTTRLQLISGYLDYINSKFLNYFITSEQISVDEFYVKFKGRISFITYKPKKNPTKRGMNLYSSRF